MHKEFPLLGELLGGNPLHDYVGYLTADIHFETIAFDWTPVILSIVIAVLGWVVGWWLYGRHPERARAQDPLRKLRASGPCSTASSTSTRSTATPSSPSRCGSPRPVPGVDSRIVDGIVNGVAYVSEWVSRVCAWIDQYLVDGAVNLVAAVSSELGRFLNLMMNGRVQQYLLVAFFGTAASALHVLGGPEPSRTAHHRHGLVRGGEDVDGHQRDSLAQRHHFHPASRDGDRDVLEERQDDQELRDRMEPDPARALGLSLVSPTCRRTGASSSRSSWAGSTRWTSTTTLGRRRPERSASSSSLRC